MQTATKTQVYLCYIYDQTSLEPRMVVDNEYAAKTWVNLHPTHYYKEAKVHGAVVPKKF